MTNYQSVPFSTVETTMGTTWKQGEHIMVNGPTGCGKTTVVSRIVRQRRYVVMLVTKVYDKTISGQFKDFDIIETWPPRFQQERVLLWPKATKEMDTTQIHQRKVFKKALNAIFTDRNWCVVFDEQSYFCNELRLELENKMLQHQGRSSGLSVINGAQRPKGIPLITMSGSTHCFLWQNTLKDDLTRLSDIGGVDKRELEANMLTLSKHEFIYINTRTGLAVRSQVER